MKRNIFNGRIWPDFTLLPYPESPVMSYETISSRGHFMIDGYTIYATKVRHRVPTYGYMIIDPEGTGILYPGDTGPTERVWKRMRGHNVKAVIVGVSFPDEMRELALISGHLTPSLLKVELTKMPKLPEKIYVTHIKPHYQTSVEEQLSRLDVPGIEILKDRMTLVI